MHSCIQSHTSIHSRKHACLRAYAHTLSHTSITHAHTYTPMHTKLCTFIRIKLPRKRFHIGHMQECCNGGMTTTEYKSQFSIWSISGNLIIRTLIFSYLLTIVFLKPLLSYLEMILLSLMRNACQLLVRNRNFSPFFSLIVCFHECANCM